MESVTADPRPGGPDPAGRRVIDMHAHLLVPERNHVVSQVPGVEEVRARTRDWIGPETRAYTASVAEVAVHESTDTSARLVAMDAMGVDIQAVSMSPSQYDYWVEPGVAREIVEIANEAMAELVSSHPDRIVGIADVALGHPDLAAEQLERAVQHWGLRGEQISSRAGDRELSSPELEPFWAAAEAVGVPVIVHPIGCSLGSRLASHFLSSTVGQPVEHAVALSHLIFSGVLDRHPALKVFATHGGGYLPFYLGRSDHAWQVRPDSRGCVDLPSSYLPRMYFDSLVYRGDTLRHLLDLVGSDHVAVGSDYPYDIGVRDPVERLSLVPGITEDERSNILYRTGSNLLGLPPDD
ncbi:MAG: amidohydrolase family protein [Actinomycetia bacterium]|nr:amidohydrolase family protein [Actinomycetes bacterium]